MATKLTGRLAGGGRVLTQVSAPSNVASADTRNVTDGPTTLDSVMGDNQKAAASNTKVWVKIYDQVDEGWTPGTDLAFMGFPLEAWTSADDSQAIGTNQTCIIPEGLPIEKGISLASSKEAGDLATAAPATNVLIHLVHS